MKMTSSSPQEDALPDEGSSFLAEVTTEGRITGDPHQVTLRLVYHRGRFYASRTDRGSDWIRNVMENNYAEVSVGDHRWVGEAKLVEDGDLERKISEMKYDDQRDETKRVVVEITPTSEMG